MQMRDLNPRCHEHTKMCLPIDLQVLGKKSNLLSSVTLVFMPIAKIFFDYNENGKLSFPLINSFVNGLNTKIISSKHNFNYYTICIFNTI